MAKQKTHNKKFVDEMNVILLQEKDKITQSLSRFSHRNKKSVTEDFDTDLPSYGDDLDENANEIAEYSNNLSLENELEKELRDINSALKRVEDGTYGICKYTNDLISENRLRARPTSTSSIASKKTLTQEF